VIIESIFRDFFGKKTKKPKDKKKQNEREQKKMRGGFGAAQSQGSGLPRIERIKKI
jgi:hypothetical protein